MHAHKHIMCYRHLHPRTRIYTRRCAYIHTLTPIHTHTRTHAHTHAQTYTLINTPTHTPIHTQLHKYTP